METEPFDKTSCDVEIPPPYEATGPTGAQQLQIDPCTTLVLDGTQIYSRLNSDRAIYKINSPPYDALMPKYGLKKVRYKASQVSGAVNMRSREYDIYTIVSDYVSIGKRNINIFGQADSKMAFRQAEMSQGIGPSSFKVPGHFQTERSTKNRLQHGSEICWKDTNDRLIAIETKVERDKQGTIVELPRLDVKVDLDEKVLDLLVACWCARLWRQAEKELTEPISWDSIKKTIGRYSKRGNIWGGY